MREDRTRWDDRYAGATAATPRPPDALAAAGLIDLVPSSGRLLDVAAGLGPVSRWAAQRGLEVIALDISPLAVGAIAASPEGDRITAVCVDLDAGLPANLGRFDLVVCQRFRDIDLFPRLADHVAPDGLLVVTVLSEVGADAPGPFHAPSGELRHVLATACVGWSTLADTEADGEASLVVRRPANSDERSGR